MRIDRPTAHDLRFMANEIECNPTLIDFETYFDDTLTLRKMTTSEYVRALCDLGIDETVHCVGLKICGASATNSVLTAAEFRALAELVNWRRVDMYGWNLQFDGLILSMGYGAVADAYMDGMGVSRALYGTLLGSHSLDSVSKYHKLEGKEGGGAALMAIKGKLAAEMTPKEYTDLCSYCLVDNDLAHANMQIMRGRFPAGEHAQLSWSIKNYVQQPMLRLNPVVLQEVAAQDERDREALLAAAGIDQATVNSNEKFATLLRKHGVEPPRKLSKTTGKETYAFAKTDKALTDLLEDVDPAVRAIVEARLGTKTSIIGSRCRIFERHAFANDFYLRPALQYGAAHTGRFGGGGAGEKQNLQNLTKSLKPAIIAEAGHVIVNVDASQIELRTTLTLAGQTDILELLNRGEDTYSWFASKVFNRPITKANKRERQIGKVAVLSLQYGAGWKTFQNMLRVMSAKAGETITLTEEEAKDVVAVYRRTFGRVTQMWLHLGAIIASMAVGTAETAGVGIADAPFLTFFNDRIRLPSGLNLLYPDVQKVSEADSRFGGKMPEYTCRVAMGRTMVRKNLFGGLLLENLSQSLARTIIKDAHDTIVAQGVNVVLQVHDSVVMVCREEDTEATYAVAVAAMSRSPDWWPGLKLTAAGNFGFDYGSACEDM
jgi:DNA polymerase bacteriophage-type